ncbi:MAG: hypothetical protein JWL73_2402 [Actinomycetia bacterium]|nr:hypothetical protein [Actinomycetes bacterium]
MLSASEERPATGARSRRSASKLECSPVWAAVIVLFGALVFDTWIFVVARQLARFSG